MTKHWKVNLYKIGLYMVGFLLLLEWLRPLEVVTDTGNSIYFVYFIAVCFLLYFLRIPFWFSFPFRFVLLLYILHNLFFTGAFLQVEWLHHFYADIVFNSQELFASQWLEMSDLFRTFLFMLLLWVMSYLIHYWLFQAKRIFGFYILTIIYLGVLDTFTKYDAGEVIVRTMVIGIFLLGALQMLRLKEKEGVKVRFYWLLPLSLMVVLAVCIGIQAPKAGPQWPDPVPFIKSAATEQFMGGSVHKIGYGVDDSRLGGAFVDDDTTVFTAEIAKDHYWRVESKDYYTGKGWVVSEDLTRTFLYKDHIDVGLLENVEREPDQKAKVMVENIGFYPHIAYPPGLRALETDENIQLLLNRMTGKLFTEKNAEPYQLNSYGMTYDEPIFSIEALNRANEGDFTSIKELYTQLPGELPERVSELARDITKNSVTRYEKAKAIETYFSMNGFVYETKDVAIPEDGQDYVDQFLFETKKGYCDNYSSSMVILLRTLDIPARWVKGYTKGEFIETLENGLRFYEVKNSNAHSWVEVYFPGIGWVPFEPTQGFTNTNTFIENALPEVDRIDQSSEEPNQQQEKEEEKKESEQDKEKNNSSRLLKDLNIPIKEISLLLVLITVAIGLAVIFKRKWYPYWVIMNYRIRKNKPRPEQAVETLLLLLESKGLKVQGGETLREYACRVDESLGTSWEMKEVTEIYEKLLYSKLELTHEDWNRILELWENLVKKIVS